MGSIINHIILYANWHPNNWINFHNRYFDNVSVKGLIRLEAVNQHSNILIILVLSEFSGIQSHHWEEGQIKHLHISNHIL